MAGINDKYANEISQNNKTIALSLIVICISLLIVFVFWAWFGYIGPSFSEDVLLEQQKTLTEKYNLPAPENTDNPELAQIPPSLREFANSSSNTA